MASLKRVSDGRTITPRAPTGVISVQYPQTWFDEHLEQKPLLSLQIFTSDMEKARNAVAWGIANQNIKLKAAITFLYLFAKNTEAVLESEWKSYGRTIGIAGATITPLDLVKITTTEVPEEMTGKDASPQDDSWMAMYILSLYRMLRASVQEYRSAISLRITAQMKALNAKSLEMTDIFDLYRGWENDRAFNFLSAMFDMFFHRFPLHPLSNLRIATTSSRNKDCAALMSYGYIQQVLGMKKITDLMDWVFVEQIGNDIDRMMDNQEELNDDHSYFPYQVDFGLVSRTAFSASANPCFFEWTHLIGSLLRQQRSMNARHICDGQSMNILLNAACVAFAHAHTFNLTKVYTVDGLPISAEGDDDLEMNPESSEHFLTTRDPEEWLIGLQSLDNQMPTKVREYLKKVGRSIKDAREGSINAYLSVVVDALN